MLPYFPERRRDYHREYGQRGHSGAYYRLANQNAARTDSWPLSGLPPGSDLSFLRAQLLDRWDMEHGIMLPLHAAGRQLNLGYAAARSAAINDWQVAEWIEREPRLWGSIIVAYEDGARTRADRFAKVGWPDSSSLPSPAYSVTVAEGRSCVALGTPGSTTSEPANPTSTRRLFACAPTKLTSRPAARWRRPLPPLPSRRSPVPEREPAGYRESSAVRTSPRRIPFSSISATSWSTFPAKLDWSPVRAVRSSRGPGQTPSAEQSSRGARSLTQA